MASESIIHVVSNEAKEITNFWSGRCHMCGEDAIAGVVKQRNLLYYNAIMVKVHSVVEISW